MASVQDLETRVGAIERRLSLLMSLCTVTKRYPSTLVPGEMVTEQLTAEDLYKEIQAAGGELKQVREDV